MSSPLAVLLINITSLRVGPRCHRDQGALTGWWPPQACSVAVVSLANTKRDLDLLEEQLEEEQGGKSPAPQDIEVWT